MSQANIFESKEREKKRICNATVPIFFMLFNYFFSFYFNIKIGVVLATFASWYFPLFTLIILLG